MCNTQRALGIGVGDVFGPEQLVSCFSRSRSNTGNKDGKGKVGHQHLKTSGLWWTEELDFKLSAKACLPVGNLDELEVDGIYVRGSIPGGACHAMETAERDRFQAYC